MNVPTAVPPSQWGRILAVARADFFERTRRYSYLVTLLATIWAAVVFLPPNHSSYATLELQGHRGIYNSAWVGALIAMLSTIFISLAGFYLVKNTLERDRMTRVGPILAATSLTRLAYVLGKVLSNFAVLSSMVVVLGLSALVLQFTLMESRAVDLVALWLPLLLIPLPVFALTSAVAVLFETLRPLRGGLGNVVYFFGWMLFLTFGAIGLGKNGAWKDATGTAIIMRDVEKACVAAYPTYNPGHASFSLGLNFKSGGEHWDLTTFTWRGVHWTASDVGARLFWVLVALALAAISSLGFDRFDESGAGVLAERRRARAAAALASDENSAAAAARRSDVAPPLGPSLAAASSATSSPAAASSRAPALSATPKRAFSLWPMWKAECALLIRGHNLWWYVVAAALIIFSLTLPLAAVRGVILPLSWIWPVLIWSGMGSRERREGTDGLLFSAARPVSRQLPAAWLAGVTLAVLTGAGVALRLGLAGETAALGAWAAGALFIPGFALACGVWSGGRKLFEVLYLLLWYGGPMHHTPTIDFMGTAPATTSWGSALGYIATSAVLLALAAMGRARQTRG